MKAPILSKLFFIGILLFQVNSHSTVEQYNCTLSMWVPYQGTLKVNGILTQERALYLVVGEYHPLKDSRGIDIKAEMTEKGAIALSMASVLTSMMTYEYSIRATLPLDADFRYLDKNSLEYGFSCHK